MPPNYWMIMNWKYVEGSGRGLIFKVISRNLPGETEENHETFSQDSWHTGQHLNQIPPEYKSEALALVPIYSVPVE
jgi:hypothetical protein